MTLRKYGFTLIEIMLVVIIITALAAMVVPRISGRSEQAKIAIAKTDIANIATALKIYELENGNFPTSEQGLNALMKKPANPPVPEVWNGPYIENPPTDPWGRTYVYVSPGEHRLDYDLSSKGKNDKSEDDDIVNWQ
ncbi:MAG: type II secretion system major pseudopilin GspG [Candidatus Omnitrophota bacterium]|nr:type II secretion system major pseudopilin GspG [Candidatus Omnitrophota bacterium]MDZ4243324.1 type II secretion system major pseudopilin GspG [Candidatus Omnitrophota bacterium]